jgi:hypothetical protein
MPHPILTLLAKRSADSAGRRVGSVVGRLAAGVPMGRGAGRKVGKAGRVGGLVGGRLTVGVLTRRGTGQ